MKKKQRPTPSLADSTEVVKKLDEASKVDTILKQKKTHTEVSNMPSLKIREAVDWCAISRQLTTSTASTSSTQSRTFLMSVILQSLHAKSNSKNQSVHEHFKNILPDTMLRKQGEFSESCLVETDGIYYQILKCGEEAKLSIQFQGVFFALQSNPMASIISHLAKVDDALKVNCGYPEEPWVVTRIDIAQDWNMPVADLLPDPHTDKSAWYTWSHRRAPHSKQGAKGKDIYTGFSLITHRLKFRVYDKKLENKKKENNESKVKYYDNLFSEHEHVSRCEIEIKSARECLFATSLLAQACSDESKYIEQAYLYFRHRHNLRIKDKRKTESLWEHHPRWNLMFPLSEVLKVGPSLKNFSLKARVKNKEQIAQELMKALLLSQGHDADAEKVLTREALESFAESIKNTILSQIKEFSEKETKRLRERRDSIAWLNSLKRKQ